MLLTLKPFDADANEQVVAVPVRDPASDNASGVPSL
jgi:hypothetical protein